MQVSYRTRMNTTCGHGFNGYITRSLLDLCQILGEAFNLLNHAKVDVLKTQDTFSPDPSDRGIAIGAPVPQAPAGALRSPRPTRTIRQNPLF